MSMYFYPVWIGTFALTSLLLSCGGNNGSEGGPESESSGSGNEEEGSQTAGSEDGEGTSDSGSESEEETGDESEAESGNEEGEEEGSEDEEMEWTSPEEIDNGLGNNAGSPQVTIDSQGNGIIAWRQIESNRQFVSTIRYAVETSSWSPVRMLSDEDKDAYPPNLVANRKGDAIVVWKHDGKGNTTDYSVWSNRYDALSSTWGEAIRIDTSGTSDDLYEAPAVAINEAGKAIVLWQEMNENRGVWMNRYDVDLSDWGDSERITTDGIYEFASPRVAIDAQGNALAGWLRNTGSRDDLAASRYDWESHTWRTPELIETYDADSVEASPSIGFDADGNALALWSQHNGERDVVWAGRHDGSTQNWWAPSVIEKDGTGNSHHPALHFYSAKDAVIAWERYEEDKADSFWISHFAGASQTWSEAEAVTPNDTAERSSLRIGTDSQGNVLALWLQLDGSLNTIWTSRYDRGSSSWSEAQLFETNGEGNPSSLRIAVNEDGRAFAVWTQKDSSRLKTWVSRYD